MKCWSILAVVSTLFALNKVSLASEDTYTSTISCPEVEFTPPIRVGGRWVITSPVWPQGTAVVPSTPEKFERPYIFCRANHSGKVILIKHELHDWTGGISENGQYYKVVSSYRSCQPDQKRFTCQVVRKKVGIYPDQAPQSNPGNNGSVRPAH